MALQPVLTVQSTSRTLGPRFSCLVGVPIASIPRFDPSLASQRIKVVLCRPPFMLCFRRNRFRRNAFATYLVLLVFLKLAFQGPLLWTFLLFQAALRRYDTICLLSVLPYFFSVTFLGLLHVSDLCSRRIAPRYGFICTVFSVPYILSGARHFERCFERNEYFLVDPFSGWLCYG